MYERPYPEHWNVREVKIKCDICGSNALKLKITCGCGDYWEVEKCKRCEKG